MTGAARRRLHWLVLLLVLAGALFVGGGGDGEPASAAQRANRLAAELRCPTCRSQSALESDAEVSRAMRTEIRRRIDAGEADGEIRAYFVSKFGRDILLRPEGSGVSALVWVLPVVALAGAAAGLVAAFRRWRPTATTVSPEDERLVEEALRSS